MAKLKAPTSIGGVDIDPTGASVGEGLVFDGTKFQPGPGGGTANIVDPVEPVDPEDGLIWTNPDESPVLVDSGLLPQGVLGYAEVTAAQTGISTLADLTGLAVTCSVPAGRRIRITGHGILITSATIMTVTATVREGSTSLNNIYRGTQQTANTFRHTFDGSHILTPSAGSHTYKLSVAASAGTIDLEASSAQNAYIVVEDIGAA